LYAINHIGKWWYLDGRISLIATRKIINEVKQSSTSGAFPNQKSLVYFLSEQVGYLIHPARVVTNSRHI